MRIERHVRLTTLALASAAMLFLLSCEPAEKKAPPPPTAAAEAVYVIFEGPWAIVPDPDYPDKVLALAPKTKDHRPLAVVPTSKSLEAGVYDLEVPPHGSPGEVELDKGFLRANVDRKKVQDALNNKMERYAVRLPKPETYRAETRYESRVGTSYPPDASTQQHYVTAVSLVYHVTTKAGFRLAGTKDVGGDFLPQLPDLDTPMVRFVIDPAEYPDDGCNAHSRRAFHDLVHLLGLTLYVDFPEDSPDCHKKDPQLAKVEKAMTVHGLPLQWPSALFGEEGAWPQAAGLSNGLFAIYLNFDVREIGRELQAAFFFFHSSTCKSPIIVGGS